jgi:hypothetical protein
VRWHRARHSLTWSTLQQRDKVDLAAIAHEQRLCIDAQWGRVQQLIQYLKTRGLSGGEAHRLDQYVSKALVSIERLAALKEYRTPQAFRAFARIYIQLLPMIYGPYYIELGGARPNGGGNIVLALVYAVAVQVRRRLQGPSHTCAPRPLQVTLAPRGPCR